MNAPEFKLTLRTTESKILYFNGMYNLPVASHPGIKDVVAGEQAKNPDLSTKQAVEKRLLDFRKALADELSEVDDIIGWMNTGIKRNKTTGEDEPYAVADLLTDIADWLTDVQVYCMSEMAKYGLPLKECMDIVMASNFSKLGADGKPIYDEHGKVLKGPGYWKPEPQLKALIVDLLPEDVRQVPEASKGIIWRE